MAILVTGGTGFIGSHTVVELINAGKEVVIVDNFSNSKPEVLNRIEKITGTRPVFYQADLLDKPAIDRIFEEQKIDAVIHFAGFKAVGVDSFSSAIIQCNCANGNCSLKGVLTILIRLRSLRTSAKEAH